MSSDLEIPYWTNSLAEVFRANFNNFEWIKTILSNPTRPKDFKLYPAELGV